MTAPLLKFTLMEEAQLAELAGELADYEARFGMASDRFFAKYTAGEMGDDADLIEWQVLYQMQQRLCESAYPPAKGIFPART